ncbi:AcrR family transcriptional regulator [Staphylococcus pasteuri]|uniref:Transcriptional regulator, TetR family n=2 Tax=Staphylococcus TaxID=1279 RepID=A0ABY1H341_9STAP|nr:MULTISPECIES: TetR/AcrR family transcriptional regulator [Staphylococcus]ATH61943.1 TetR family transcriptional regulator [Staphylococcus pasteuri]KKI56256.1 TetR family regulatory protein of MDR cluster [Staphylococcus pasteuri]MCF7600123.1 TetR/AcrR family transcriptional regulator [Staphylococcus pasteuri]MDI3231687.1 TetR/AcrR family transcriptional regulator [Staphylococcus pasteuri]MDO6572536.1 TetR/AcrR family transcriptional regulator [Staphylococcus pasteuri_A]
MKRKAKFKIIQSMINLLDEYPFEDITIKMICAYSGVNRSTFYDNYKDKYDLLEKIQNYHLSKYTKLLTALYNNFESVRVDTSKLYKFFLIVAKYIKRKEAFYRAVFITYPNKGLALEYFQATKETYEHVINDYPNSIRNKSLFITYSIGGEIGVIFYWLRNGCQESPEEIAENLLANTVKLQR